jgi:hypothetical protein
MDRDLQDRRWQWWARVITVLGSPDAGIGIEGQGIVMLG